MDTTLRRFRVIVPTRFYEDHVARDCSTGEVVKTIRTNVMLDMTPEELQDLRSDAEYYASLTSADVAGDRSTIAVIRSAQRTLAMIKATLALLPSR